MKNNKGTVENVKAVFFDILANQVSSLINIKDELNANPESANEDLNRNFDNQFELLRNTLSNVDNLMTNVEQFNGLQSSKSVADNPSVSLVPNSIVPDMGIVQETSMATDETEAETADEVSSEDQEQTENSVIPPLIPISVATASFEDSEEDNNVSDENNEENQEESTDEAEEEKEDEEDDILNSPEFAQENSEPIAEAPVEIKTEVENAETEVENTEPEVENTEPVALPEVSTEQQEIPAPISLDSKPEEETVQDKYIKISNAQPKAIIVNAQQLGKLRSSKDQQKQNLDFGQAPPKEDKTAEIQNLMQQANMLYKQGNAIEAEQIYQRVRELNKQN